RSAGTAVLLQQIFLQGTGVDADANRNLTFGSELDDFFDAPTGTDISRIQPETSDSLLERNQSKLIVEGDVGNQRDANLLLNSSQLFRRFTDRHGHPDNVAT